jgi:hypothetical protein
MQLAVLTKLSYPYYLFSYCFSSLVYQSYDLQQLCLFNAVKIVYLKCW